MALTLSDVNKKVRYKGRMKQGRLLSLTTDHNTAFVEWDSFASKASRESVPAHLLQTVEETGTENAG